MKPLYTLESFIEKANLKHNNKYDYSKSIYVNLVEKIIITCPIHGEFSQAPNNHLKGSGCTQCGLEQAGKNKAKNCAQTFIERAVLVHGNQYDYSQVDYKKAGKKVEIICPIHGAFQQSPNQHLGGRGCRLCGIEKRSSKRRKTFEEFVQEANEIHDFHYEYPPQEYLGRNKKIKIKCPIHGEFFQRGGCHLNGKGCPSCGEESKIKKRKKSQKQFISQAYKVHGEKFDYSKVKYENGRKKVEIICPIHGSFFQTPEGHLSGRGCKSCTYFVSKKETEWLTSLGIPDDDAHRNVTLKVNDKIFRVDGFDPSTKTVYEFNGDYWHGNPAVYHPDDINEKVGLSFKELHEKTIERESLLRGGGFQVVSIWESEWSENLSSTSC